MTEEQVAVSQPQQQEEERESNGVEEEQVDHEVLSPTHSLTPSFFLRLKTVDSHYYQQQLTTSKHLCIV